MAGIDVISDTTGKAILEQLGKGVSEDTAISIKTQLSRIADALEAMVKAQEETQKATIDENGIVTSAKATMNEDGVVTIPNATIDENGVVTI